MDSEFKTIKDLVINKPIIAYKGVIGIKEKRNIVGELEARLDNKVSSSVIKRVYFVAVELLNNVNRHGIQEKETCFVAKNTGKDIFILCENLMYTEDVVKFKKEIERLNKLFNDEGTIALKRQYKQKLNTGYLGQGAVAGLGLIELIRRSHNEIVYNFIQIDVTKTKFSIIISLPLKKP